MVLGEIAPVQRPLSMAPPKLPINASMKAVSKPAMSAAFGVWRLGFKLAGSVVVTVCVWLADHRL